MVRSLVLDVCLRHTSSSTSVCCFEDNRKTMLHAEFHRFVRACYWSIGSRNDRYSSFNRGLSSSYLLIKLYFICCAFILGFLENCIIKIERFLARVLSDPTNFQYLLLCLKILNPKQNNLELKAVDRRLSLRIFNISNNACKIFYQ